MNRLCKLIICILILLVVLAGCFRDVKPYEFRQSVDQIECIEIRRKEYDSAYWNVPTILLKTLDPSEYKTLVDAVTNVPGNYLYSDPATSIGPYQIWIYYKDGEVDMIGVYNSWYILPDGDEKLDSYMFDVTQFHEMLSGFLGETVTVILPEES